MKIHRTVIGTLTLLLITPGCWPQYRTEKTVETLDRSVEEVSEQLPEKQTINLRVQQDTVRSVEVKATRSKTCRKHKLVSETTQKVERKTLKTWSILGNIGATAVGFGLAGYGFLTDNLPSDVEGYAISGGLILGVLNAYVLGSSAPPEPKRGRRQTSKTRQNERVERCGSEPAADLEVQLLRKDNEDDGLVVTERRVDASGTATFDFESLADEGVNLRNPFGTIRCNPSQVTGSCEPVVVRFSSEKAAQYVRVSKSVEDATAWLAAYRDSAPADLVSEIESARSELRKKYHEKASQLLNTGRKYLGEGKFNKAIEAVNQCLNLEVMNDECYELADRVKSTDARKQLENGKILTAFQILKGAVENIEHPDQTEKLLGEVKPRLDRARPARIEELAILDEPSGYRLYFAVVNKYGDYIAPEGTAQYEYCQNPQFCGRAILETEVSPNEYEAVQLGKGIFARGAVVHSTFIERRKFYKNLGYPQNIVESNAKDPDYDLKIQLRLRTPDGTEVKGQTDFWP